MPDSNDPPLPPENIGPLLRLGLDDEQETQMVDPNMTIMGTAPAPRTGSSGEGGRGSRGWSPPSVEELQQALPQYEISAFIACGGMGAVYKGTQKTLRRPVAIKVLPPEMGDDTGDLQFAARFKHEAQAMAQLSHPNIVAVFDAAETPGGLLYFVMEFVEGTDVAQLIASEGQLGPLRAIQITTAVCEALAFAHEEGIIHRDIKPSNIMIDKKGRVKVADFGLAKTVSLDATLLTGTNLGMGTPDFIAPEALISGIKVDGRADIYAVGVMLYQMLTGTIPRGRFQLPSGVVPQMDKGFDAVVDKAMQTDRDKRYSTAMEMKTDVERVGTRSGGFQPPPFPAPAVENRRSLTKSRKPLLLAAAAVVVLSTGAFFLTRGPQESGHLSRTSATTAPGIAQGPAAALGGPSALPAALEARAIKLWDSPEKLSKAPGIRWEDEAMRLDDGGPETGPESRNAILRASVRNSTGRDIVLSLRKAKGPAQARLTVDFGTGKTYFSTAVSGAVIGEWSLPRAYAADEWVRVELRAIGDDFTVLMDGEVIGTAHSEALSRPGKALLYSYASGFFRDIVYIPLDDLSEAEVRQAVGISASTPQWRDALAEEQLKTAVTKMTKSPSGYVFPPNSNWVFPSDGLQAGALRWRGVVRGGWPELAIKESDQHQFLLGISRSTRRPYIAEKKNAPAVNLVEAEEYAGFLPKDGEVSELVVTRAGGKLGLLINGRLACEVALPQLNRAQFVLILHGDPVPQTQSLEYINLDGLPEAEARQAAGISE